MPSKPGLTHRKRHRSARELVRESVVWLLIPGVVHAAVIVLLMHLQFLVAQQVRKEAVIDTALEEIDIHDNPVEHLAPVNVKTSATAEKRLDWRELLRPDTSQVQGPDERNILKMLEATEDEPLVLRKISVPVDGLSAMPRMGGATEAKSSVAAVVDSMTRELAKMLTKRNVLLVWLFDESRSMRQSQREVRQRIGKVYGELQGPAVLPRAAKLVSAVVSYGKESHRILAEPSANPQHVQAAIDRIPLQAHSPAENVMAACRSVMKWYRPYARVQKRILVIFVVTDERGDDTKHVEAVLATMKRGGVRVFVLGGEARWQQKHLFPRFLSPEAPRSVLNLPDTDPRRRKFIVPATANIGPACAFPETLYGHQLESAWYGWKGMSGFGFWALSRLAKETGGTYYVLHGPEGPTYDPDTMVPYAPELCSRDEYIRRCKASRIRGTIHRLHADLLEYPFNWPGTRSQMTPRQLELAGKWPFYGQFRLDSLRSDLDLGRRMAQRRVERLTETIRILESGTLADAPHAPTRWEANRQLALADCYALRWSAKQRLLAIQDFIRKPRFTSAAEYYVVSSSGLHSTRKYPILGGTKAHETLRDVYAKYDAVIANHPGTPWAECARRERRIGFYRVMPKLPDRPGRPYTPAPPPPPI